MPSRPPGSVIGTKNLTQRIQRIVYVKTFFQNHLSKNRFHLSSEQGSLNNKTQVGLELSFIGTRAGLESSKIS